MPDKNNDETNINESCEFNPFREEEAQEQSIAESAESEEAVDKIKTDFENLNNQYLRLAADFENYRKRQAQEREQLINYGKIEAFTKLLEVLDNFDRAEQSLKDCDDVNRVKESFNVLHKQIVENLEKMGLAPIETVGSLFDPNFHDAVMQTPTEDHPDQTIIAELQKGYKLGDKVLRPALVNVATN